MEESPPRPTQAPGFDGAQEISCAEVVRVVEHERFVELTASGQVGLPEWQAGELGNPDCSQVAEARDGHTEISSYGTQSIAQEFVRCAERDHVAAVRDLPTHVELEQPYGNTDTSAILDNEGITVAETFAVDFDLPPGLARTEDKRDPSQAENLERLERLVKTVGLGVEQCPVEIREDNHRKFVRGKPRGREIEMHVRSRKHPFAPRRRPDLRCFLWCEMHHTSSQTT